MYIPVVAKKGSKKGRKLLPTVVSDPQIAQRHEFSLGILGHDLTATSWIINVGESTALALDVVQQCVQLIGDTVAGADVGQWNRNERIDPPSGFTLRPDPEMTRRDFLWLFAANLALYRAVWLEEATFDGQVIGTRLQCVANVHRVGDDIYIGTRRTTNNMKLVRLSVWPTLDVDTGSTITLAREVFAGAMAANAYSSDYWQQGGAPLWYLKSDQPINDTQAEALQARVVERRTTAAGAPMVFGQGADLRAFGADIGTEGANISADKLRASMARYFNMQPDMVNVLSEAGPLTYSTVEAQFTKFVRVTAQPYCDVIGEALSAYLPGDYLLGDRIVIDPRKLMEADQFTRYQSYDLATGRKAWLLPSEVRLKEGLPASTELDDAAMAEPAPVNVGGGFANE